MELAVFRATNNSLESHLTLQTGLTECWRAVLQDTSSSTVSTEHGASLLLPAAATLASKPSFSQNICELCLERIQPVGPNNIQLSCSSWRGELLPLQRLISPTISAALILPAQPRMQIKKNPLVLVCNRAVRSLQSNLSVLHINTLGAPSLPVVIQDTDQFNFPSSPSHYSILSSHNIKQNHSKNKLLLTEMKNKKVALFTKNDHSKGRDNQNKGTWLMALDDHWTAYQINGR